MQVFTWINKQGVKSDKGFVVQSINRFVIKYSEGLSEINVSVERGMNGGKAMVYIYEDEFYQWSDGRKPTEQKKCEILNNFISAMEFQGVDVEIQ